MPNTSKSSKKVSPANGAAEVTEFDGRFHSPRPEQRRAQWPSCRRSRWTWLPSKPPSGSAPGRRLSALSPCRCLPSCSTSLAKQSTLTSRPARARSTWRSSRAKSAAEDRSRAGRAYSKIAGKRLPAFRTSVERSVEHKRRHWNSRRSRTKRSVRPPRNSSRP